MKILFLVLLTLLVQPNAYARIEMTAADLIYGIRDITPDGISEVTIDFSGQTLQISGYASSGKRLAEFMKAMELHYESASELLQMQYGSVVGRTMWFQFEMRRAVRPMDWADAVTLQFPPPNLSTPEAVAREYCEAMLRGDLTSSMGYARLRKMLTPDAEKLLAEGGRDGFTVIRSCRIAKREASDSRAKFAVKFEIVGDLSGGSHFSVEQSDRLDELELVSVQSGVWKIARFKVFPAESIQAAYRGVRAMRDFECPDEYPEAGSCRADESLSLLEQLGGARNP